MKNYIFVLIIIALQVNCLAQNKKKQTELSIPLHPWTLLSKSYYIQAERFHNPIRSTIATIGYQGQSFLFWWSNINYKGVRADIGQRIYINRKTAKYVRLFAGVNATFEYSDLHLKTKSWLSIPSDSLQTKGLSFAPEINVGLKIVAFKRLTITPSIGYRYYFNTLNTNRLTHNPAYWKYDDWDNTHQNWEDNRKTIELRNYRKGSAIIPYFNIGFIVKI